MLLAATSSSRAARTRSPTRDDMKSLAAMTVTNNPPSARGRVVFTWMP